MPDRDKKFHEFALQSMLFKGRSDWYFCFLKAEKIAQVLAMLARTDRHLQELAHNAAALPTTIAHFAAGEVGQEILLADIFSLISSVRVSTAGTALNRESALLLIEEFEQMAQRIGAGTHPSPFARAEDFAVPELEASKPFLLTPTSATPNTLKDTNKGHKGQSTEQSERASLILDFVKKNRGVSIKEIVKVVQGCSEKTVQRELAGLIIRGLVKKVGERRWSIYLPNA